MEDLIHKRVLFSQDEYREQLNYWLEKLSGDLKRLELPTDTVKPGAHHPQKGEESDGFGTVCVLLPAPLSARILQISKESDLTVYILLLAALKSFLYRYTGCGDILVASPVLRQEGVKMYNDLVILRNWIDGNRTCKEILLKVRESTLQAYRNQDYPWEFLFEEMGLGQGELHEIINTAFVHEAIHEKGAIEPYRFDLLFSASGQGGRLELKVRYNAHLFLEGSVRSLTERYGFFLDYFAGNLDTRLSELELLTPGEMRQTAAEDNSAGYPETKTLHALFEEQADRTPDNTAIRYGNKELTYRELDEMSNRIANYLIREHQVTPDTLVGIFMDKSENIVAAALGILKAGGGYVPVDPSYPEERVRMMIDDAGIRCMIASAQYAEELERLRRECASLDTCLYTDSDEVRAELEKYGSRRPASDSGPDNIAYVIFTSGTTGKPKGVIIEHRHVVRLLINDRNPFEFSAGDTWTLFHSFCFDLSVWEMFGALLYGGRLVVVPKIVAQDGGAFLQLMKEEKVTVLTQTPTAFYALIEEELGAGDSRLSLRYIVFAGEALSPARLGKWKSKYPWTKLVNMYGITETTVHVTYKEITELEIESGISNIGKPIPTLQTYVMDKNRKLLPAGAVGELYVGGTGVGRGYLNRPELTVERFLPHPFLQGQKMYKSGDLVRMLPCGEMEYLGRMDQQVKIRGFRVELAEIESRLIKYPSVRETAVVAKKDNSGVDALCAYIVSDTEFKVSGLRKYLAAELPEYMIPSYFIRLLKIPVNSNGKLDRKALPEPNLMMKEEGEVLLPQNALEENLLEIWKHILGVEKISTDRNFFELGGHSLKATTLIARMHEQFEVEVPLVEVFKTPTIKGLAEYIANAGKKEYLAIERAEKREYYPVSSAQRRLFVLNRLEKESIAYNMPAVIEITGRLDVSRIKEIFGKLADRHEALRTSFAMVNREPVQRIQEEAALEIGYTEAEREDMGRIARKFIRPFDLGKPPLWRVELVKTGNERHVLLVDMHHIISDGTSVGILVNEFMTLYAGGELPELRIQYKDYSEWQNNLLNNGMLRKQEEYWVNRFSGEIPVLNLPYDAPRPSVQSFEGNSMDFLLGGETGEKLKAVASQENTTLYMVLLAVTNILLAKYSGQEDIVVGSPVAARRHADLTRVMGMFVNTLAMRNRPEGGKNFREFLREVGENALSAYENQEYPFEELVGKMNLRRDMSRNPLFDVMLVMQNTDEAGRIAASRNDNGGIGIRTLGSGVKTAKFDLTVNAVEQEEGIRFELEYCTKLFTEDTVRRMAGHFRKIAEEIADRPDLCLQEISLLSEEEKKQVLYEFNQSAVEFPRNKTIHQLFEEQAERTPENIAIVFEEEKLTYGELNVRVNRLAGTLRQKGAGPGCVVGIMAERSIEMVEGIMGILKAGGAYLPIDPGYPEERIRYMLEDSGTGMLLIQKHLKDGIRFQGEILELDDREIYHGSGTNPPLVNQPEDLAYVLYTSGSTGRPKGVMVEHRSVVNILADMQRNYPLKEADAFLLKTTYTFDISAAELFGWFFEGGRLVLLKAGDEKDPKEILKAIEKNNITHINFVPSMLSIFLDTMKAEERNIFDRVRYVLACGEALPVHTVNKFYKLLDKAKLENIYGPTESTIYATRYSLNRTVMETGVPIGKPMGNIRAYILDTMGRPQPAGIIGELYLAGCGLARGYIHREELTRERFVSDPFLSGERMYRTGDLARWLPDGNIEFFGRVDNQVKIRGYRIEIDEIEEQLRKVAGIREAVVTARSGSDGSSYLCAYYAADGMTDAAGIKRYLSGVLPEYMLPAYYIKLERLPLTSNGKVDRKLLPEPEENSWPGTDYEAPANEMEERLVGIWQDILKKGKIGTNHSFFEIGGNSLNLILAHSDIDTLYPGLLKVTDLFANPTVKKMAEFIQRKIKETNLKNAVKPLLIPEEYLAGELPEARKPIYQFKIRGELQEDIRSIAASERVADSDVLLSAYFYLLAEIAAADGIVVHTALSGSNTMLPLFVQTGEIESIGELIRKVGEKRREFKEEDCYRIGELEHILAERSRSAIRPAFVQKGLITAQVELPDYFDVLIEFDENGSLDFQFTIGRRIRKEKGEEIVRGYARLIELAVQKHHRETSRESKVFIQSRGVQL